MIVWQYRVARFLGNVGVMALALLIHRLYRTDVISGFDAGALAVGVIVVAFANYVEGKTE